MLNYIWIFMMVASFVVAAFTGRMDETLRAFLESGKKTFDFALSVGGVMTLWSGIMAVAEASRLTDKVACLLSPVIGRIFRGVEKNSTAERAVSMNIMANFLGLANAATPLGIKAMKELAKNNSKDTANFNMTMLAVVNSASVQLIPSTLIAMRTAAGSVSPGEIILPIWIVSVVTALSGIILVKLTAGRGIK